MGQSKKSDSGDGPIPSPRTTIVGGRPPDETKGMPPVPTGIQKLLRLAHEDEAFRRLLLAQRGAIAPAAGIDLSASERAILAAVAPSQLKAMIDRVPPPSADRRAFFRQTAASAVVLLGGASLGEAASGCSGQQAPVPAPEPSPGPTANGPFAQPPPEDDPERPDYNEMYSEGGAAPDEPPERPDHHHMAPGGARPDVDAGSPGSHGATRGIRPDMPPERPDHSDMMRTGGAAPDMPPDKDEGY